MLSRITSTGGTVIPPPSAGLRTSIPDSWLGNWAQVESGSVRIAMIAAG